MEDINEDDHSLIPQDKNEPVKPETVFKKPILFGKVGRLPKKLPAPISANSESSLELETNKIQNKVGKPDAKLIESQVVAKKVAPEPTPTNELKEKSYPLPYKEPVWSGLPSSNGKDYSFDVLKNGVIIETVNLMEKPFWVFGRFVNCDIIMQHPTISRYHAVLQYRREGSETDVPGFYIYDLGSTHGTFLNKNRLKPKIFVRIQVGHMLKFGNSTRSFILEGPEYDEEEESELSVTELKEKRDNEIREREERMIRLQQEAEEKKRKEEERGVDWGLGEDADEETDLSENPYAQTNNEELYLDDPKKALRGFFEREGLDLEYDCNEQGMGQFVCKVELPVDDEMGRPIVAEVLHKGKKKEAVIQCALEACRILDRFGVLRQATHESRKRKAKNWEDNDYYDSDEDTYLDRTGTIEKKREKRMNSKAPQKIETYESLVEKEKSISASIADTEIQISSIQFKMESEENQDNEEDSLDSYMKGLKDSKPDKRSISRLKTDLVTLRTEHSKVVQLINLVKPANLPPLVSKEPSSSTNKGSAALPLFGKRKKIQIKFEQKPNYQQISNDLDDEEDDNDDTTKDSQEKNQVQISSTCLTKDTTKDTTDANNIRIIETTEQHNQNIEESKNVDPPSSTVSQVDSSSDVKNSVDLKRYFDLLNRLIQRSTPLSTGHQKYVNTIRNGMNKVAASKSGRSPDRDICLTEKKKVDKLISDSNKSDSEGKLRIADTEMIEFDRMSKNVEELEIITKKLEEKDEVTVLKVEIINFAKAVLTEWKHKLKDKEENPSNIDPSNHPISKSPEKTVNTNVSDENLKEEEPDSLNESTEVESSSDQRKKKRNQRRIHQRQGKQEQEKQKGYEDDASRENYSMWVPPSGQSGDGRTNLNDKYGY
ncbi:kanadaptin [Diabrotica virgifera virgifera]|uniref:FHA domain-containing protein n=1 Tax=Diabrotica virgifera virgifera TaxID=50390 RepID=A0ABM5KI55_DIAVI|nr:kanadaptin [Diabrotica virgifera virgifera]